MWAPMWNDAVKIESGGRYPLLLNRFHDHMEGLLIKGIVSLTDRLRYISYCCWAIGDIEKTCRLDNYSEFVEAFRRRENALALGLYLLKQEDSRYDSYTIYGSDRLSRVTPDDYGNYNCSFKMMQSVDMGAYELYYGGTMYNWGLVESKDGIVQLTGAGWRLHDIVAQYYIDTRYYTEYRGEQMVPGEVLMEWAEINSYDNIIDDFARRERDFYKEIIFRLDETDKVDYRRDTFALFLECIDQCNQANICFNEDILRNIHYFGRYYDVDGNVVEFQQPDYFSDVIFYWKIYELHVYFRWWVLEYFKYFLTVLKSKEGGMTIEAFIDSIDVNSFNNIAKEYLSDDLDYFNMELKDILNIIEEPTYIDDKYSEETITLNSGNIDVSGELAKFVIVMASLYRKFEVLSDDNRYLSIRGKFVTDYWFDNLFMEFEGIEGMSIAQFLAYVLKKYIIEKHDRAMYEKKDLRRCWFTKENNRYIFQADTSSIWRPAKYMTIMRFLFDMNLIAYSDDILELTGEGVELYEYLRGAIYL